LAVTARAVLRSTYYYKDAAPAFEPFRHANNAHELLAKTFEQDGNVGQGVGTVSSHWALHAIIEGTVSISIVCQNDGPATR
jgi:hypothetical protein